MTDVLIVRETERPASLQVIGETVTTLADTPATGSFECFVQQGDAGVGPPPHEHAWDEVFFVLDGRVGFAVGDKQLELGKGDFAFIPRGTVHAYQNLEDGTRMLTLTSGGQLASLFQIADEEVKRIPEDLPRLLAAGPKLGITFHVPPPAE